MMKRFLFIVSILFSYLTGFSQSDSSLVLSFDEFYEIVKEHHPIARQANLQIEKGDANLRAARGGFDPKVQADFAQKNFEEQQYYDLRQGKLKIPTWFGVEMEAGLEQNQGDYINPENNTTNDGLLFAGISIPLGEGLFIDQRRADLRKAQAMVEQSNAEQRKMLNYLLFEAGKAYWEWFMSYQKLLVFENALQVADERFKAVKENAILGDIPFIDTLEAGIQLQNRQLNLQEAKLQFKNKTAFLSTFLWQEGFIPIELDTLARPENFDAVSDNKMQLDIGQPIDSLLNQHPELMIRQSKIEQISIERRWKSEQLKPTLNLKYQPITRAIRNDPLAEYSINNYTWGVHFSFPILLRKERGELKFTELMVNENKLTLESKKQEIEYQVKAAFNEFETTQEQFALYTKTTEDYFGLLEGERELFDLGESSLFMINSREMGYINARLKLIELLTNNQKSKLRVTYSLGILQ